MKIVISLLTVILTSVAFAETIERSLAMDPQDLSKLSLSRLKNNGIKVRFNPSENLLQPDQWVYMWGEEKKLFTRRDYEEIKQSKSISSLSEMKTNVAVLGQPFCSLVIYEPFTDGKEKPPLDMSQAWTIKYFISNMEKGTQSKDREIELFLENASYIAKVYCVSPFLYEAYQENIVKNKVSDLQLLINSFGENIEFIKQ